MSETIDSNLQSESTQVEPVKDMFSDMMEDIKAEKEEEKQNIPDKKKETQKESSNLGDSAKSQEKNTDPIDYKEKYEKSESFAQENMKYARSVNQKLKETLKIIDDLVERKDIDQEVSGKLFSILKKESIELPKGNFSEKVEKKSTHPFDKHKERLDQDLFSTYIDVSEDQDALKKLNAFDQYLLEAEEEEISALDKELISIQSPMALLKKILSVGQVFLDEGLGEFYKHGGFRKYLAAQKEENKKLKTEVDKMSKKLRQYESNESSKQFWLGNDSEGSKDGANLKETGDMWKDMQAEEELERRRHRR